MRALLLLFLIVFNGALQAKQPLELHSPVFQDAGKIPTKYSCQGRNISPALTWANKPNHTKSYVLLMIDYDAQRNVGFPIVHWIAYNIPAESNHLEEGALVETGLNGYGKKGYIGMCPPFHSIQQYSFFLFALNIASLKAPKNPTIKQVITAIKGHVIEQSTLIGTYARHIPIADLNSADSLQSLVD
jgi:Raf kinase inhibitor-like YbhB/YbcL family protein